MGGHFPSPLPKIDEIQQVSAEYIKFIQYLANHNKLAKKRHHPDQIHRLVTKLTEDALHLVAENSSSVKTCYSTVLRYNNLAWP